MKLEYLVDYATFVLFPDQPSDAWLRFNPTDLIRQPSGWFGYSESYRHMPTGAMMHVNPDRTDMGVCWRFSGQALAKLQILTGANSWRSLMHLGFVGKKATRLDCTVDVYENQLPIHELVGECRAYNETHDKAQYTVIEKPGVREGMTIYRYRREYRKFLRIYDRAAVHGGETGVTRIEAEFKSPLSTPIWGEFCDLPSPYDASSIIRSTIRSCADFGHSAWGEIFGATATFEHSQPDVEHDTADWLVKQVAPTLARSLLGDCAPALLSILLNAVKTRLQGMHETQFDDLLSSTARLELAFSDENQPLPNVDRP